MYRLYEDLCQEKQSKPVSQAAHIDILHKDFNYSFKQPINDTCKTCDMLNIQIKSEMDKPETSRNMENLRADKQQHKTHITENNIARQELKKYQTLPTNDPPPPKVTITFDLQQTLPAHFRMTIMRFTCL